MSDYRLTVGDKVACVAFVIGFAVIMVWAMVL